MARIMIQEDFGKVVRTARSDLGFATQAVGTGDGYTDVAIDSLQAGVYQYGFDNGFGVNSGLPSKLYHWGVLVVFKSVWGGVACILIPDKMFGTDGAGHSLVFGCKRTSSDNIKYAYLSDATSGLLGGVIADILDFSYQTQERMVA